MRQSSRLVILPKRIGGDILDEYRLLAVGRRTARSGARSDRLPVYRRNKLCRQTRTRAVADVYAVLVEQEEDPSILGD